jgi:catechol 2,3-dioxygenase-like lactoylglutathione lyase family enzyme
MNVTGILHVNINCSDFDRSRQFYEMLGFWVVMPVVPDGSGDVAAAVGMEGYQVRGALMRHKDRSVIDLLEWQDPRDERPDIERLSAEGVEFLSQEVAVVEGPDGSATRFICFRDPDGTVLELVEMATGNGD